MKGFLLGLAVEQKRKTTQKSPISKVYIYIHLCSYCYITIIIILEVKVIFAVVK